MYSLAITNYNGIKSYHYTYYIDTNNLHSLIVYFALLMCQLFVLLLQNRWTATHFAAFYNCPNVIKLLISKGADITVITKV